jgi:cobalt-zinc-cadmium efflux system membrane fusion protein
MMKNINIKSIVFILSAVALVASCGKQNKAESKSKEPAKVSDMVSLTSEQISMSGIETGHIEMRQVSSMLKLNGEIASLPQNTASVSVPMGGRVKSISVIPGAKVGKGQVLAYIENYDFIDLQQNYLETKNKMEYVELEYQRQRALFTNDASSKKNLQLTTSEYKILKIQLSGYVQKLLLIGINPRRLTSRNITHAVAVKSPISGYVKNVNVSVGSTVSATDDLFDVVNLNNLFIRLTVFEKDIDKLQKGQQLSFFVNDEAEIHHAVVYQTTKSIDDDKSYKVFARIVSHCGNVLPGMYVNAEVMLNDNKVSALPDDAVVTYGGKDYIFVCTKEKGRGQAKSAEYKMVEITKGVSSGGYTQVTLPENISTRQIVVKGSYNILSALKNAGEED